ncbi:MAG: hypothetical protein LLF92_02055 [Planctomycetaceae bacterium]|nr:hypothetical protein [Planctomycetaceae bacterium]
MFEKFYRAVFFSIFAAVGILAVSLAVLGPEWKNLYKIKAAAAISEQNNTKITRLLADHQELISLINTDPNVLRRLAAVELGRDVNDPNDIAAQITADFLSQAKFVVDEVENPDIAVPQTPHWLIRATLNSSRVVLFASGAGLILVSFVCFSAPEQKNARKSDRA